jgi:hypothetical protein
MRLRSKLNKWHLSSIECLSQIDVGHLVVVGGVGIRDGILILTVDLADILNSQSSRILTELLSVFESSDADRNVLINGLYVDPCGYSGQPGDYGDC